MSGTAAFDLESMPARIQSEIQRAIQRSIKGVEYFSIGRAHAPLRLLERVLATRRSSNPRDDHAVLSAHVQSVMRPDVPMTVYETTHGSVAVREPTLWLGREASTERQSDLRRSGLETAAPTCRTARR
jgi:hypothetical protein